MPDDQEAEAIVDSRPDAAEHLLAAEQRAVLREALGELPDDTREVLTLFYREGQSVAQVAALLELSEDAIKKRLSRARSALRHTVLERLGETLGATAPGAAFGMAVMAALPLAAPATASALSLSASKAASTGSAGPLWAPLAWLFKAVAAVAITAVGGVLGVVLGARALLRDARDDQERRQLRWFRWASIAAVIATSIGFELRSRVIENEWADLIVLGGFTAALLSLHFLWLPRILRRRFEAEMREDPVRALAARRRERRGAILGWTLGLGVAWVALVLRVWL
jgi:hypothetical protein